MLISKAIQCLIIKLEGSSCSEKINISPDLKKNCNKNLPLSHQTTVWYYILGYIYIYIWIFRIYFGQNFTEMIKLMRTNEV